MREKFSDRAKTGKWGQLYGGKWKVSMLLSVWYIQMLDYNVVHLNSCSVLNQCYINLKKKEHIQRPYSA